MYSRSLLYFLLAVPFAANAVPVAEQKHNGKPIQYVTDTLSVVQLTLVLKSSFSSFF